MPLPEYGHNSLLSCQSVRVFSCRYVYLCCRVCVFALLYVWMNCSCNCLFVNVPLRPCLVYLFICEYVIVYDQEEKRRRENYEIISFPCWKGFDESAAQFTEGGFDESFISRMHRQQRGIKEFCFDLPQVGFSS